MLGGNEERWEVVVGGYRRVVGMDGSEKVKG